MIRHPMQKCPAEFVPVFQEILENTEWKSTQNGNYFIYIKVRDTCLKQSPELSRKIIKWIDDSIEYYDTFNDWLADSAITWGGFYFTNQCRKAWLEWLVSPEGHE